MLCIRTTGDYKNHVVACKEITFEEFKKMASDTLRRGKIWRKKCTLWVVILCLPGALRVAGGDNPHPPKFVGSQSCSSSSCHGGAAVKQNEFTIWSKQDFHRERPVARLETRRAEVITEAMGIGSPLQANSCTICHAPLQTVPAEQLAPEIKVIEGISCENCHAPAENWLRSHTRKDWTTADRVQAGMRDLKNLYVRANTCVACHQNVEFGIRHAGHPELIFELDGQCAAEPRHWQKSGDKPGPQIWLVGQAVALREISWQLSRETGANPSLHGQWEGLLWLMQLTGQVENHLPTLDSSGKESYQQVQQWSDELAKAAANLNWSEDLTRKCLNSLAETGEAFAAHEATAAIQARRAERLVLALDRLLQGSGRADASSELNHKLDRLFADVQSLSDFNAAQFAQHLNEFHTSLALASN